MSRVLTLSLLVSTALTGCGTGSTSDNSGSQPPPSQTYTFEFVRVAEPVDNIPADCTIFDVGGQNSGTQTYVTLAPDVRVEIHNADGSFKSRLTTVSDSGVLTFSADDIEAGGYISIIDSPSNAHLLYTVLSIQKELLADYVINIDRPQSISSCYVKNKGRQTKTGYPLLTDQVAVITDGSGYETSHSSVANQSNRRVEVEVYDNEKVLEKAYHNNELVGYAFIDEVTTTVEPTDDKLIDINNETLAFNELTAANELQQLTLSLANGEYDHPWYEVDIANESTFPYVSTEATWSYRAQGTTSSNWNFALNGPVALSTDVDIQLPASISLSDNAPVIATSGPSFSFQSPGFSSTETRLQRSEYNTQNYAVNTDLKHVIYSVVAPSDNVTIPDLDLADLSPLAATSTSVVILQPEVMNQNISAAFLRDGQQAGQQQRLVSVLFTPAERINHNKTLTRETYTQVSY